MHTSSRHPTSSNQSAQAAGLVRQPLRQPLRESGMGYGNSSSYGRTRRYASDAFAQVFRIG